MKTFEKHLNTLILKTNESILVSGINIEDFSYKIIIESDISQKDLAVVGTHPLWLIKLELLSKKNDNSLLIIKNIDRISKTEQLRFLEIIKYKSISGFKLPNNSHLIITYSDLEKVADKIKSNCLVLKAE